MILWLNSKRDYYEILEDALQINQCKQAITVYSSAFFDVDMQNVDKYITLIFHVSIPQHNKLKTFAQTWKDHGSHRKPKKHQPK